MKIEQKRFLRPIFSLKGNFAPGITPPKRIFDGIEIAPFWNACPAAVSISADFELNWAFRSLPAEQRDRLGIAERDNVPYILGLLDEFDVPITWATVGHLFLGSCARSGRLAHPEMPRPPFNGLWQGDWYKHDPCTDLQRDPLWYAADLIQQVMAARVRHEIGSHSFSHVDFSAKTSDPELIAREMEASLAAMAPLGLRLRSLVYPFNHMGHSYQGLLHQFGIIAVRHRDDKVRLSYPVRSASGVYEIYESMNLRSPNLYDYRDKAELFLDHAMQHRMAYHLWFHPSDPRPVFHKEFREILRLIQRLRDAGEIWAATMGDLAAYCEARECTKVEASTEGRVTTLRITSTLDTGKYGSPDITFIIPAATLPTAAMPNRIERSSAGANPMDHRLEEGKTESVPTTVCSKKNGSLILNLPAVTQTIRLTF